jgi:hypothetical protein
MDTTTNHIVINGFKTEDKVRDNSYYTRFTDDDIEGLAKYAYDMGYTLEPELLPTDTDYPMRFKISSKTNPDLYGWISKVIEKKDEQWQDAFLYGFYRNGSYRNKYPITFNVQSHLMRGVIKRNTMKNPRQEIYYRTVFGIIALEPQIDPINFVLSWLSSCKFQYV